jgi:hypothetical protein
MVRVILSPHTLITASAHWYEHIIKGHPFGAKKPVAGGLKLRFVRFSGQALTQGVENIRIDGVPVRIYSAAKTIADCLKYTSVSLPLP